MKLTNKKLFRFFPFGLAFILMMNIIGCNRSKKQDETGTGADTGEPGKQYLIKYQSGADEYFGRAPKSTKGVAGETVTLRKNTFLNFGYTFIGWSDGKNTYSEGAKYTVPEGAVSFTAVWGESEKKLLTYDYGTKKVNYNAYLGELITVPSDAVREGYVFAGWQDGDKVYRPGTTYTMKDKATTLTANWVKIDDFGLLSDAVGAWELREGGTAGLAPSAIGRQKF